MVSPSFFFNFFLGFVFRTLTIRLHEQHNAWFNFKTKTQPTNWQKITQNCNTVQYTDKLLPRQSTLLLRTSKKLNIYGIYAYLVHCLRLADRQGRGMRQQSARNCGLVSYADWLLVWSSWKLQQSSSASNSAVPPTSLCASCLLNPTSCGENVLVNRKNF